ncbi:hypothetical protein L6250_04165 [Candidatus Parcubacteria bacterium]|nr:hypothetical protein [Patescibacteria group bacterium]MBU4466509.1 hypothetical protein [Patescibacteria group bacterium]MCG2688795.1 hypothetical protein [Candidatus Parcubacteria bacterium]
MEITERQKSILEKLIEEYVKTAEPVASAALAKKHAFGIKPAMLRIEMEKLEKAGYLSQPFVSAGRIPTDKAYRFFVNNLLMRKEQRIGHKKSTERIKQFTGAKEDRPKATQELTRIISELTSSLVLSYLPEENLFFKEGWSQIIREPEFEDSRVFESFAKMIDSWEKDIIPEMDFSGEIKIFIGKENPSREAEGFSAIAGNLLLPDKERGVMAIFGPKRMEYDRNIDIINSIINIFSNDF